MWYDRILTLKQMSASQTAATRLEEEERKCESKSEKVKVMEKLSLMKSDVRTKEVKSNVCAKVKVIVNMKELAE